MLSPQASPSAPYPPLLAIVGPTAAGKSALALELAEALGGEIVSADSMQVYRGFDIGTGKLSYEQRRGIVHHLIDMVAPDQRFSAAEFVRCADQAIAAIRQRGRCVIVVGGTGLYMRALLRGLFVAPPPEIARRMQHKQIVADHGLQRLFQQLETVDPDAASSISPNDFIRISRALEVFEQTGQQVSVLRRNHQFGERRYEVQLLGLRVDPPKLRAAIDARVDMMLAQGWLDEVRNLRAMGYAHTHPMGALGYKSLNAHLDGALIWSEAVWQTKRDTWRFARRQRNWFDHEPDVLWIDREAITAENTPMAKWRLLQSYGVVLG